MNYLSSLAKTWNSLNPATLSGAIDVIVIEDEKGNFSCSPFHIRFGKFQLLRPSQKKVDFKVNGELTNIQMKLGDGGEAFFVFQADTISHIPNDMMTSPVVSAASSAVSSPLSSPKSEPETLDDSPEYLDLNSSIPSSSRAYNLHEASNSTGNLSMRKSRTMSSIRSLSPTRAQKLSKKLTMRNIPTKIDTNGELVLDMSGYKASEQDIETYDNVIKELLKGEFGDDIDTMEVLKYDSEGNLRIHSAANESEALLDSPEPASAPAISPSPSMGYLSDSDGDSILSTQNADGSNYIKTLRLTSDQLKCLNLNYGANDTEFTVGQTKSTIKSRIFLWKHNVPVVISDIDGTITKSDALGHVFNMIGKDWTHEGVAKLFDGIARNGYNIMYLTARSVGLSDTTRTYLDNIEQDGYKLPLGPVILSPDRTMAALKREVILKKPEVFKITCLKDLRTLYGNINRTPFYAGFGNRITDALSYRSVEIPSSKIFTINPDGDVHMELLELAGYKSSYIHINELVDHFFPPVNTELLIDSYKVSDGVNVFTDENYTDTVFWRDPIPDLSDSDTESIDSVTQNTPQRVADSILDNLDEEINDIPKELDDGESAGEQNENQEQTISAKDEYLENHDDSMVDGLDEYNNAEEFDEDYNDEDLENELDQYDEDEEVRSSEFDDESILKELSDLQMDAESSKDLEKVGEDDGVIEKGIADPKVESESSETKIEDEEAKKENATE